MDRSATTVIGAAIAWTLGLATVALGAFEVVRLGVITSVVLVPTGVFVLPPTQRAIRANTNIALDRVQQGAIWVVVLLMSQLIAFAVTLPAAPT